VNGHDSAFSCIVFMEFEVKGGARTLCAIAAAPYDTIPSQLNTLQLVLASSKRPLQLGAQLGIIDLMTMINDMFEEAMEDFPG
jgi:hypothetical protein